MPSDKQIAREIASETYRYFMMEQKGLSEAETIDAHERIVLKHLAAARQPEQGAEIIRCGYCKKTEYDVPVLIKGTIYLTPARQNERISVVKTKRACQSGSSDKPKVTT